MQHVIIKVNKLILIFKHDPHCMYILVCTFQLKFKQCRFQIAKKISLENILDSSFAGPFKKGISAEYLAKHITEENLDDSASLVVFHVSKNDTGEHDNFVFVIYSLI